MLHLLRKHALWTYFVLAFILTWGGSAVVAGQSTTSSAGGISSLSQVPAALLVLLGPAIAALAASSIEAGWHGVSQVLRSLLIWRVGWKIWIFIIFYPLLHHLLASILRWAIWETPVHFFYTPALSQNSIVLALATAIAVNLIRGLGEEIGWRGYALPRLQCRWNAWWSSVILGYLALASS
jgi:membrane protease YdiL (CAAX protease family)